MRDSPAVNIVSLPFVPEPRNVTLIIKPTHSCNLDCPYCYDKACRENYDGKDMSLDMVQQIINVFGRRVTNWIWHGGEPLMMGVDYYRKANRLIRENCPQTRINMQSNGTLVDESVIELLQEYGIKLGLSFDGIQNELTRKSTVELLKTFKLMEEANLAVDTLMVLTPDNIQNIIAEYEYSKRIGIPTQMNTIFEVETNKNTVVVRSEETAKYVCKMIDYWLYDQDPNATSRLAEYYMGLYLTPSRRFCCEGYCSGRWFSVHPDGAIYPCGREWDESFCFGNIMEFEDIKDILATDSFKRFKKQNDSVVKQCLDKNCEFFYMCGAGCFRRIQKDKNNRPIPSEDNCVFNKIVFSHVRNLVQSINYQKDKDLYNPRLANFFNK